MNTFGDLFRLTTFGESHGPALGFILDGMPAGVSYDESVLTEMLIRRMPGKKHTSSRKEEDVPKILSGVFEGITLGTPIACFFENKNAKSKDYENLPPRRGHADEAWVTKYGHTDHRGGGRSSGRETVARVGGAAFSKMLFNKVAPELTVKAVANNIGPVESSFLKDESFFNTPLNALGFFENEDGRKKTKEAEALLQTAKANGQSYGGTVEVRVQNPPKSLGEPTFKKLKAKLAEAVMGVGAVKSFSLGDNVNFKTVTGTEFHSMNQSVYGGISGGLSTGETLKFFCDIKPTSSILDVAKKGRHDPCILPRALVVLESMVYLVLADLYLNLKIQRL